MKTLVAIANYGTSQLKFLERVVYEYTHLNNHHADVYVHTNVPVREGDILTHPDVHEVFITDGDVNGDWQRLPYTTRKTLLNGFPDYDIYIYSENDILIEEKNIDTFIEASEVLKNTDLIPGFLLFEVKEIERVHPQAHGSYKWDSDVTYQKNGWHFIRFTNDHYAAFVLTRDQFNKVLNHNNNFLPDENVDGYQERTFKVKHCTSIFRNYGFTQVIPVSRIEDFLIRHLPDKYNNRYTRNAEKELKEYTRYIGVDMPYVRYSSPYSYCKNVGVAYNREFLLVGDDDWVCLTDGDAMFLTPDYGHQIGYTIAQQLKEHPDGFMLTCYTNRVGCKQQRYPQTGVFDEKDISRHKKIADEIRKKYFSKVTQIDPPVSGVMMCIPKKIWNEIKFKEQGILSVDNDFSTHLTESGYPILRMDGLYMLHYYRMNEGKAFIKHLL